MIYARGNHLSAKSKFLACLMIACLFLGHVRAANGTPTYYSFRDFVGEVEQLIKNKNDSGISDEEKIKETMERAVDYEEDRKKIFDLLIRSVDIRTDGLNYGQEMNEKVVFLIEQLGGEHRNGLLKPLNPLNYILPRIRVYLELDRVRAELARTDQPSKPASLSDLRKVSKLRTLKICFQNDKIDIMMTLHYLDVLLDIMQEVKFYDVGIPEGPKFDPLCREIKSFFAYRRIQPYKKPWPLPVWDLLVDSAFCCLVGWLLYNWDLAAFYFTPWVLIVASVYAAYCSGTNRCIYPMFFLHVSMWCVFILYGIEVCNDEEVVAELFWDNIIPHVFFSALSAFTAYSSVCNINVLFYSKRKIFGVNLRNIVRSIPILMALVALVPLLLLREGHRARFPILYALTLHTAYNFFASSFYDYDRPRRLSKSRPHTMVSFWVRLVFVALVLTLTQWTAFNPEPIANFWEFIASSSQKASAQCARLIGYSYAISS